MGVVLVQANMEIVHVLHTYTGTSKTEYNLVGFYFLARTWQETLMNKERHRHRYAGWFSLDALPEQITAHALRSIQSFISGVRYSED